MKLSSCVVDRADLQRAEADSRSEVAAYWPTSLLILIVSIVHGLAHTFYTPITQTNLRCLDIDLKSQRLNMSVMALLPVQPHQVGQRRLLFISNATSYQPTNSPTRSLKQQCFVSQSLCWTVGQETEQRRQSIGVFAAEADQAGWTQLMANLETHQPPMHDPNLSPAQHPNQQPPAEAVQQEAHEVLSQAVQTRPSHSVANLLPAFSADFQYDSPDVPEEEAMPAPPPQHAFQPVQSRLGHHPRSSLNIRPQAPPEVQSGTPSVANAAAGSTLDERQGDLQHGAAEQGSQQRQHGMDADANAVIPQTDGAADSDSPVAGAGPVATALASPITQDHLTLRRSEAEQASDLPADPSPRPALSMLPKSASGTGVHSSGLDHVSPANAERGNLPLEQFMTGSVALCLDLPVHGTVSYT